MTAQVVFPATRFASDVTKFESREELRPISQHWQSVVVYNYSNSQDVQAEENHGRTDSAISGNQRKAGMTSK